MPDRVDTPIVDMMVAIVRVMMGDSLANIFAATGSTTPIISSDAASIALIAVRSTAMNCGLFSVSRAIASCVLSIFTVTASASCTMGMLTRMEPLRMFMYCDATVSIVASIMLMGTFAYPARADISLNTPLSPVTEPGWPILLFIGT